MPLRVKVFKGHKKDGDFILGGREEESVSVYSKLANGVISPVLVLRGRPEGGENVTDMEGNTVELHRYGLMPQSRLKIVLLDKRILLQAL